MVGHPRARREVALRVGGVESVQSIVSCFPERYTRQRRDVKCRNVETRRYTFGTIGRSTIQHDQNVTVHVGRVNAGCAGSDTACDAVWREALRELYAQNSDRRLTRCGQRRDRHERNIWRMLASIVANVAAGWAGFVPRRHCAASGM